MNALLDEFKQDKIQSRSDNSPVYTMNAYKNLRRGLRSTHPQPPPKRGLLREANTFFQPLYLLAMAAVLLVILVALSWIELTQSKREILHVIRAEAFSFVDSLSIAGENAIASFDEVENLLAQRLLNNARLLKRLDRQNQLSPALISQVAEENNIYRINVFDRQGKRVMSSHQHVHLDLKSKHSPIDYIHPLLSGTESELVIGLKESRHGVGERFAAAVRRDKGGAIVLNIDAAEMLNFRRRIGLGRLIQDIGETGEIRYIALQDEDGIVVASKNLTRLERIKDDKFLSDALEKKRTDWRYQTFGVNKLLEVVKPFIVDGVTLGLFRIGLSLERVNAATSRAKTRLFVLTGVFLAVGVFALFFLWLRQNYALLGKAYHRIKTYTGNVLANVADAIIVTDSDCIITVFNQAAENLFLKEAQHTIGQSIATLEGEFLLSFEQTLREKQGISNREMHYQRADGKLFILAVSTSLTTTEEGEIDSVVAVIKDLTKQKKLEAAARRQEKLTAMGELASGVAHEIRNPLNTIGMIAQRLKREFSVPDGEYDSLLTIVRHEVSRVNDIIGQFLRFARPPSLQLEATNMTEFLDDVILQTRAQIEAKGIQLQEEIESLPEIKIDKAQMKQALLNLILNAIEATSAGGKISISAHVDVQEVRPDSRDVASLRIEIADTGMGIPEENLAKKNFRLVFYDEGYRNRYGSCDRKSHYHRTRWTN